MGRQTPYHLVWPLNQKRSFVAKQPAFSLDTAVAGVPDHASSGADDAVAGNDNRNGIASTGAANHSGRAAEDFGDIAICDGLPAGNTKHLAPYSLIQRIAFGGER